MNIDFNPDAWVKHPLLAAVLGALVGLRFAPGISWAERAANVFCGLLLAAFIAPALVEWLRINSAGMQAGLSFVVGLFGLSLAAAILQGIRETRWAEIITGWISRRR